jgi:hypothetical protein
MIKHMRWALVGLMVACSSNNTPDTGFGVGADAMTAADATSGDSGTVAMDTGTAAMDSGTMAMDSGMADTGAMSGAIPDPGTGGGVNQDFGNVEPNDTPQTATPLGIASTADVHVWVTNNTIGGTDLADYFVFKTGPMPGQFTFDICWSMVTNLNATLWQVSNGQMVTPPVHMWTGSMSCVMSAQHGRRAARREHRVPVRGLRDRRFGHLLGLIAP